MKQLLRAVAVSTMVMASALAWAQQPGTADKPAPAKQATLTVADYDKQMAQMQENMKKMHEQMAKLSQTQDTKERQKLLEEHWATMQNNMQMMHGTYGMMGMHGGGGCCGGGQMMGMHGKGHMMGGGMMGWQDYSKQTPEQMKQRQYMMDRHMGMQQQMMDQMMQHQRHMQPQ